MLADPIPVLANHPDSLGNPLARLLAAFLLMRRNRLLNKRQP